MIVRVRGKRRSLAGFGEMSWEDWCRSPDGVARYGKGNRWVCMRDLPGPKADEQSNGPSAVGYPIPFAPWTEAGQKARWVAAGLFPGPDEYLPIVIQDGKVVGGLFQTMYRDPVRMTHLLAMSNIIPGIGTVYAHGGFIPIAIETAKGAFTAFAKERGIPNPDQYALDQMWLQMFKPSLADASEFVLSLLAFAPWTAIAIHGMKVEAQNPKNPPIQRAVFAAIANNAGTLIDLVQKNPREKIKEPNTLHALGDAIFRAASVVADQRVEPDVFATIAAVGRSFDIFAEPLAMMFQAKFLEAGDTMFGLMFGIKPSELVRRGETVVDLARDTRSAAYESTSQEARAYGSALGIGANEVSGALGSINVRWKVFEDLIDPLIKTINSLGLRIAQFDEGMKQKAAEMQRSMQPAGPAVTDSNIGGSSPMAAQRAGLQAGSGLRSSGAGAVQAGGAPASFPALPQALPAPMLTVQRRPPGVQAAPPVVAPRPQPKPAPTKAPPSLATAAITGATAGAVVGNVPGALVGAGAGLIYGLIKRSR